MALLRNTRKIFRLLLGRKEKVEFWLLVAMMVAGAFSEVLAVALLGEFVSVIMDSDVYETNGIIKSICGILGIESYSRFVFVMGGATILTYVVKGLFLALQYYAQCEFIFHKRFQMQCNLVRSYLGRDYVYYLSASTDKILQVVNEDVLHSFSLFLAVMNAYTELITAVVLFLTILMVNPLLAVFVTLVLVVAMLLILRVVKPIMVKSGRDKITYWPMQNRWLMQALSGMKEMKVAENEGYFFENFRANGRKYTSAERRQAFWSSIPRILLESSGISAVLVFVLVYVAGGNDVASFVPTLTVFVATAYRLLPCLNRLTTHLATVSSAEPFLDDLLANLSEPGGDGNAVSVMSDSVSSEASVGVPARIELRDVSYRYPEAHESTLDHVNMRIEAGESVGIVGPSGGGKTTLVDVVLGLLEPQCGAVLADDEDIQRDLRNWRSRVAYIPQSIFMLNGTVRENVVFGWQDVSDGEVWEALEEAELADFVRSLPDGLGAEIGEHGVRLSGGQRQRIGIARALLTKAGVLVFDEATSALDNETEAAIMESVSRLHGRRTMLIVAHRLQTISGCDSVYHVEGGDVIREWGNE